MDLYWLHCQGPDGGVVLFAIYHTRTQVYDLIDDNRSERVIETNGKPMLHKWELIHRVKIERPIFTWGTGNTGQKRLAAFIAKHTKEDA